MRPLSKSAFLIISIYFSAPCIFGETTLWQIGVPDHNYAEFALAGNYEAYASAFPNDVDYTVGTDSPSADWPFIQPSITNSWTGSRRQHPFVIRFDCNAVQNYAMYTLDIHLVASHRQTPPALTVDVNGQRWQYQTTSGPGDETLTRPSVGNFQTYTTFINPALLHATGNTLTITTLGSWMLYDAIVFRGVETIAPITGFNVSPQPCWYHDPDGVSRKFRLDFMGKILTGPAGVKIVTPSGTFNRQINTEGKFVNDAEVLAPMPDSTQADDVTITLTTAQGSFTETVSVEPERRWEINLIHQTHLDIGYTDAQPKVMNTQVDHLYKVLDYIDQSADRPKEESFKWHPEGMWAVEEFLKRASETDKNRFIRATQDKTIHIDALYVQAMSGIYSEEELFELLGAAERYGQKYGVEINSAMQTDVPGYSWGLATALGQWGVKYLSLGPNPFHRIGHTFEWGDRPFYWISPSGEEKILVWMAGRSYNWFHGSPVGHNIVSNEAKIVKYLDDLKSQNYPYDMVQIRYAIGHDNGPPNPVLSESVHQWNTKYAYPKMIVTTTSDMMAEFERRYGSQIPVRQKDFTPYWEGGCASTSADMGLNRRTSEKIVQTQTLWSMLNSGQFPREDFDWAWQKIIMYDEHTWGAHNSISDPDNPFAVQQEEYKKQFAVDAADKTDQLMSQAVAGVRQAGSNTIDVFNTLNWPRTELVLVSAADSKVGDKVTDPAGMVVPSQRLSDGQLAFIAADVPALGSRRYIIHSGSFGTTGRAAVSGNRIGNGILTAAWSTQNGALTSLTRSGISGNLVDTGIGEGVNDYLYILGRDADQGRQRIKGPVTATVLDNGPLVATVKLHSDAPGCNSIDRVIRVVDGIDQLFISNTVDKLKVRDPESVSFGYAFNVPSGVMKIDLQWGVMQPEADQIEGANKNYFCTRRWIDVSNDTYGVTWSSLDAPIMMFDPISFLRGYDNANNWSSARRTIDPGQAFHSWVMNNHYETNYKADQEGLVTFRYALMPHTDGYDSVQAEHFGRALHQPLLAVSVDPQQPATSGLLEVRGNGIVVSTIEPSRDETALMVRLYNADADHTVPVTVRWPGGGPGSSIWLSSPFEDKKSTVTKSFPMKPFEVVTLRLQKAGQ